ncbi:hypothetical protein AHAS_Ahas03G0262600 [Arachis hypogaea]
MSGGYVRGGASRSHKPRELLREEGEQLHHGMNKVRKTGGEDFSGRIGLPPRIEDWMVAEEVTEGNGCQEGGNPRITQPDKQRRLEIMWGKNGSIDVIDLGNDFFLVKFYNSEDLDFALMEGPWKILDHYLTIRLWKPDFNLEDVAIDKIAAWIRLPGLAIEYYNRPILEKIRNIVGRTIKVDTNTAEVSRHKFARICVEVDLEKLLVSQYQINGRYVLIIGYEKGKIGVFGIWAMGTETAQKSLPVLSNLYRSQPSDTEASPTRPRGLKFADATHPGESRVRVA